MAQPSFDAAAAAYDRRVGRWSRLYIPRLVAAARIRPSDRVLDVATGTGEAALVAASEVGPGGRVLGCDLSVPMLRGARAKVGERGVLLACMDAQALACHSDSFDAVMCQLGLMFFPEVAAALREFWRVLRKGGVMTACVWSAPERAPLVSIFAEVMTRYVPAKREELLVGTSLGDRRRLRNLVADAGFDEVSVTGETQPITFGTFEEYWEPIAAGGSPGAALYTTLTATVRDTVKAEVQARMQPYMSAERLVLDTEALFVVGQK
jgi:ubiquinone/menaquinone biosynthesis C-methylase UbiE